VKVTARARENSCGPRSRVADVRRSRRDRVRLLRPTAAALASHYQRDKTENLPEPRTLGPEVLARPRRRRTGSLEVLCSELGGPPQRRRLRGKLRRCKRGEERLGVVRTVSCPLAEHALRQRDFPFPLP